MTFKDLIDLCGITFVVYIVVVVGLQALKNKILGRW
jgi:hypothetical protein